MVLRRFQERRFKTDAKGPENHKGERAVHGGKEEKTILTVLAWVRPGVISKKLKKLKRRTQGRSYATRKRTSSRLPHQKPDEDTSPERVYKNQRRHHVGVCLKDWDLLGFSSPKKKPAGLSHFLKPRNRGDLHM